jgi:hypothetical protein
MEPSNNVFTRAFDRRFKIIIPVILLVVGGGAAATIYMMHPSRTDVGYAPRQPITFSHKLHAGDMEMPCMYCHSNAGIAAHSNVPTVGVCMNCHSVVRSAKGATSPSMEIAKIVAAWDARQPVKWVRIHKLPDYVYFNHSRHITAGVDCITCHGDIAAMAVVRQNKPLSMGWCVDCHRNPAPEIATKVSDLQKAFASGARKAPEHCSTCHR